MNWSFLQQATLRMVRIELGQLHSKLVALKEQHGKLESPSPAEVKRVPELSSMIQQLEERS